MKNKLLRLLSLTFVFLSLFLFYPSHANAAASFGISGNRTLNTNQNITLTISANRTSAYNAVNLNVSFNNFTFIGMSPTGGWTNISGPNRNGNSISYAGALLGQNITGVRNVLTLTLRAPANPGTATVTVSGQVSGEGAGTGTENGAGSATFTIRTAPTPIPTAAPTPTPKPAPGLPAISSSTHPDQEAWYKAISGSFSWTREVGVIDFSYIIDTNPTTNPDDIAESNVENKTFDNLSEGTQYLHVKARNEVGWGQAAHFRVNIDKTEPDPFTITSVRNTDNYEIFFSTSDKAAGIESYAVFADGSSLGEKTSNFTVPLSTKELKIIAADKAGNSRESILNLQQSSNSPTSSSGNPRVANNLSNIWTIISSIIIAILTVYSGIITFIYIKGMDLRVFKKIKPGEKPIQDK